MKCYKNLLLTIAIAVGCMTVASIKAEQLSDISTTNTLKKTAQYYSGTYIGVWWMRVGFNPETSCFFHARLLRTIPFTAPIVFGSTLLYQAYKAMVG